MRIASFVSFAFCRRLALSGIYLSFLRKIPSFFQVDTTAIFNSRYHHQSHLKDIVIAMASYAKSVIKCSMRPNIAIAESFAEVVCSPQCRFQVRQS